MYIFTLDQVIFRNSKIVFVDYFMSINYIRNFVKLKIYNITAMTIIVTTSLAWPALQHKVQGCGQLCYEVQVIKTVKYKDTIKLS